MKLVKTLRLVSIVILMTGFALSGCKKDKHQPPTLTLKTGTGYTASDAIIAKNTNVKVGITGDKVEDDMLTLNVSYAYDGATTTTTSQTINLTGTQQQHFDVDVTFLTRNVAGSEKWVFTVTDKDGNIAQKQIVLTVN